jgi:tetratricopeptide (TPR) repeat protein
MLEEVVALAPAFARGWTTLAYCQALTLFRYRDEAAAVGLTRKRVVEAAETALRLDPHMGRAYQALSWIEPPAAYRDREALCDKALAAAPNDAEVLAGSAGFCGVVGRLREALAYARRAHELDPLEPLATSVLGLQLGLAELVEERDRLNDEALARWPDHETLTGNAMITAARLGDRAKIERLISALPPAAARQVALQDAIFFARNLIERDPKSIEGWLEKQRAELARTGMIPLVVPVWLDGLGLTDEAFELIDKASFAYMFAWERTAPRELLYAGGVFNRHLVQDPRFPRLCAKLGLCDYWIETGKWPDCADEVPYDFRAEARKAAAEGLAPHV